jgi:molybdopterin molybdotransferase
MPKPLTPVHEALAHLLAAIKPSVATITADIDDACGLVLAHDQIATLDVPAYDNSAMDGYVVNTAHLPATGSMIPVSQIIAAGHPGEALTPGTAARIFTGAPIPPGGNAVVMQENTEPAPGGIRILQQPEAGQNIRLRGHDLQSGSLVLKAGHRLQPQDLGLLASLGINRVEVLRPLTVAIINTGDEVVAPGQPLGPGQLYDSNSFTLAAMLARLGMTVIKLGIVEDSLAATEAALLEAASRADCLVTTGGVSVGEADYVREAVTRQGSLSLWKLAIKPGKPFSFGAVAGKPFFGLPGNPVAVFVTFLLLVRPALLRLQGAGHTRIPTFPVRAGFSVSSPGTRQEYLRVRLQSSAGEMPLAEPFTDQGSSLMSSISWADGLLVVPAGTVVEPGQVLEYLPFHGLL